MEARSGRYRCAFATEVEGGLSAALILALGGQCRSAVALALGGCGAAESRPGPRASQREFQNGNRRALCAPLRGGRGGRYALAAGQLFWPTILSTAIWAGPWQIAWSGRVWCGNVRCDALRPSADCTRLQSSGRRLRAIYWPIVVSWHAGPHARADGDTAEDVARSRSAMD